MPIETPLLAVVPALLIAAGILAALWRPWVKGERPRPVWAGAVALAAAVVITDRLVWRGWPGLWSVEEQRRLWIVAVLGVLVAAADGAARGRIRESWMAWVCGAALTAPILWVDISRPGTYPGSLLHWLLYSGAIAILWKEAAATNRRVPGIRTPLVLSVAAVGAGVVIAQSYALSMGLTAAGLGAGTVAFVLLALWRKDVGGVALAVPVYAGVLVGLLIASTQTGMYSTILVILSAATAGLGDQGPLRRARPWAGTLVCVLLTLALAALAIKLSPKGFDFGEG